MDEKNRQIRVAFYLRVSTEEQSEKYGWDMQLDSLEALVRSKGTLSDGRQAMVLAGKEYIYKDDISGTTRLDERPGFAKLKEDLLFSQDKKPFDMVAVYKIDRFARKLKILLDTLEFLKDQEVDVISAHESIDTSTPFGRAVLGIVGVIAELELETIKLRTQGGRKEAIKNGIRVGAVSIYGYKKNADKRLEIFDEEAKIVKLIFDKFVNEKLNTQRIADYLRDNRFPVPKASSIINKKRRGEIDLKYDIYFWRSSTVHSILKEETYIGHYFYNKTKGDVKIPKSDWKLSPHRDPVIIDDAQFMLAQDMLSEIKSISNRSRVKDGHIYLLSGLLRCDACLNHNGKSNNMTSWVGLRKKLKNKNFSYYYTCGKKNISKYPIVCEVLPIPAKSLEDYIVNFTKRLLDNPIDVYEYQKNLKSTRLQAKSQQRRKLEIIKLLNGIEPRKERLKEQHEIDAITTSKLKEKLHDLDVQVQKLNYELGQAEEYIAKNTLSEGYVQTLHLFSKKYRAWFDSTDKNREEVADILHLLIDKIIIYSRPVTSRDKISGRKKTSQHLPCRLEIKIRLPQQMVKNLLDEFVFKTDTL